jgi:multiple sugar transport system substrate-binding protein
MNSRELSRRDFLRDAALAGLGVTLAATGCQPKTVVVETTPKVVEKTVKETVIVEVEKEVTSTPVPTRNLQLTYMSWGSPTEMVGYTARPETFMDRHPNIQVEQIHAVGGDYDTKLYTMIAGGVGPDVFLNHNWKALSLITRELPLNISPLIDQEQYDLSDFFPGSVDYFRYEGELYGLPLDFPTRAMSYNIDLFDEVGLDYPSADWDDETWDWTRFLESAQALTEEVGGVQTFGWDTPYTLWSSLPWIWSNGGRMYNDDRTECLITQPESVEAIQFMGDLMHTYRVAPRPEVIQEFGGMSLFMSGRIAMRELGPAAMGTLREIREFGWDAANFPKAPDGVRATVAVGSGWYVNRATPEREAAWELDKHCVLPEMMMLDASNAGIVSARRSVLNSRAWLDPDKLPEHQAIYAENAERGIPIPQVAKQLEMFTAFTDAMSYLWEGQETAAEVFARFKEAADALLK